MTEQILRINEITKQRYEHIKQGHRGRHFTRILIISYWEKMGFINYNQEFVMNIKEAFRQYQQDLAREKCLNPAS